MPLDKSNNSVPLAVKRLPHFTGLTLPEYATAGAAGMDVLAAEDVTLAPGARHAVARLPRADLLSGTAIPGRPASANPAALWHKAAAAPLALACARNWLAS